MPRRSSLDRRGVFMWTATGVVELPCSRRPPPRPVRSAAAAVSLSSVLLGVLLATGVFASAALLFAAS